MNKFAFSNDRERVAFYEAISSAPEQLRNALLKHAASFVDPMEPPPGNALDQRLEQLRDMLHDYLAETNLNQNPQAIAFVEQVVGKMRPVLQQSLQGQQSLEEQLRDVPRIPKAPMGNNPVDIVGPQDIQDLNVSRRPVVLPKDQKISPNVKKPIFRNPPPPLSNQASSESWGIQRKSAMTKDETYDNLLSSLLEIADMADAAGLYKQADKLAAVLPAVRTVKLAQYEGFQNYWIANGRAFEMAYKQKRKKGDNPDEYRSAHEVWFEILEEFQKSLLTNQADFIAKYAGKNFSSLDRAASGILMGKIHENVKAGSSPGVAFYESVEQLGSGRHVEIVAASLKNTLEDIKAASIAAKQEALSAKTAELLPKAAGFFGDLLRRIPGLRDYKNPTTYLVDQINQKNPTQVMNRLIGLYKQMSTTKTPETIDKFYNVIAPIYPLLSEYANRAKLVQHAGMPELPSAQSVEAGDAIDPAKLGEFINRMNAVLPFVTTETAKRIDNFIYKNSGDKGLEGPASGYLPDDSMSPTSKPTPTPTPTPTAHTPATVMKTLSDGINGMGSPEQYDALSQLFQAISKWEADPQSVAAMKASGKTTTPTGKPIP